MAKEMASNGFFYGGEEIKIKIHNITNKYREEKKKVGPSGGSPSSWNLYERVNSILGGFKFHNLQSVVEESIHSDCLDNDVTDSDIFGEVEYNSSLDTSYATIEILDEAAEEFAQRPKKLRIPPRRIENNFIKV
ncbi:uncharacterized protein [Musca autumnalis]|uniref:uncharacterized protein n=1 Tax=Musca autumnalis TaxID=221902 RepID=UPI003CF70528